MKWMRRFKSKAANKPLLAQSDGIILGCDLDDRHLVQALPKHVLAIVPTRSSKHAGVMMPNLLNWSQSLVVTDIKGQLYKETSHWRSTLGRVGYFNPLSSASLRWNPLHEIQHNPLTGAMLIAGSLLASLDESPFHMQGAQNILEATILHVLHDQCTLESVTDLVCATKKWAELVSDMNEHHVDAHLDQVILTYVAQIEAQSDAVKAKWFEVAQKALYLWSDPSICQQTSSSDFCLRDLKSEDIFSLYMVIEPSQLSYLAPLVRLFFNQLSWALTTEIPIDDRHLLVICDEMPAFGPMRFVEHGLQYMGIVSNIQWLMRCHALGQIQSVYESYGALLDRCSTKIVYRCNDEETAQHLASNDMTAKELMTLQEYQVVIFQDEHVPVYAHKIFYYEDHDLLSKMTPVDFPTCRPTSFVATEPVPEDVLNSLIVQDKGGQ